MKYIQKLRLVYYIRCIGGNGGLGGNALGGKGGGNGGKVFLKASSSEQFINCKKSIYKAPDGYQGTTCKRGKNGENIEIIVPIGTIVTLNRCFGRYQGLLSENLVVLSSDQQLLEVSNGGKGGGCIVTKRTSGSYGKERIPEQGEDLNIKLVVAKRWRIVIMGVFNTAKNDMFNLLSQKGSSYYHPDVYVEGYSTKNHLLLLTPCIKSFDICESSSFEFLYNCTAVIYISSKNIVKESSYYHYEEPDLLNYEYGDHHDPRNSDFDYRQIQRIKRCMRIPNNVLMLPSDVDPFSLNSIIPSHWLD